MEILKIINLESLVEELEIKQEKIIYLPPYIDFMSTLDIYESDDGQVIQLMHANNNIKWLQKFINGQGIQEPNLKKLNPGLNLVEENHAELVRNGKGNNIPDFYFYINNIYYDLDAKIYTDVSTFAKNVTDEGGSKIISSFHGAKFVLAFCLNDCKYYWRVRINNDKWSYSTVIANEDLTLQMKELVGWIKLPKEQKMLTINVPSDCPNEQLPEYATYKFKTYIAVNI